MYTLAWAPIPHWEGALTLPMAQTPSLDVRSGF